MDVFDAITRSRIMARVRNADTKPEIVVRALLHRLGFRFRLHRRDLPGRPDIVLPKHRTVVLVHGCFWHSHADCKKGTIPRTNRQFWTDKLSGNVARDRQTTQRLSHLGWRVVVIWECETRNPDRLMDRLTAELGE
ncbi:MAG: DNA mismatch endonuclease Vsr [Armatimonadetes bacterium]|nr:DNA mismatch endonuclease Vsr [Armatimonadota bacterium]